MSLPPEHGSLSSIITSTQRPYCHTSKRKIPDWEKVSWEKKTDVTVNARFQHRLTDWLFLYFFLKFQYVLNLLFLNTVKFLKNRWEKSQKFFNKNYIKFNHRKIKLVYNFLTFPACSKIPDVSLTEKCFPIFSKFSSRCGNRLIPCWWTYQLRGCMRGMCVGVVLWQQIWLHRKHDKPSSVWFSNFLYM